MLFPGRFVSLCILILLCSGCSSKLPRIDKVRVLPEDFSCRIAVVPFNDKGEYPRGANLFYKVFTAELAASGFDVVQEGDVLDMYRQLRIYPNQDPNDEQLKFIGKRLQPQVIVGGDLLRMNERKDAGRVETEMTFVLYLFDAKTGDVFWGTYHKRRGKDYKKVLHFDAVNSIIGLAEMMSKEVVELWFEQGMGLCAKE